VTYEAFLRRCTVRFTARRHLRVRTDVRRTFSELEKVRPDLADIIRGRIDIDPVYYAHNEARFYQWVEFYWNRKVPGQ
jgi:hypothetical protein